MPAAKTSQVVLPERTLPIGGLAEITGVKVETIRYYEQVGLLPEPERTEGNQRRYGRRHRDRLAFIKHARDLGFAVENIRVLLRLSDKPGMACDDAHAIAIRHLADVRDKVVRLQLLERELQRIAHSCTGGGAVCDCKIIESLADHDHCQYDHSKYGRPDTSP